MTKFSSDLILWYKQNKRDLPWRKTTNVYKVWISEIILQQTRVNQGLSYYLKFIETFPTVHDLASSPEDKVLKCWQGLGYYSRARNLHNAAKYVSNELNGEFPKSYDDLLKLKGVGAYTAAAISSICFNEHRTVIDGNVFRVISRIFGIETPINTSKGKNEIEEIAHSLNTVNEHGEFNQALMEFGALQCTPKKPHCDSCIFNTICYAYRNSKVNLLPIKEKKLKIKERYFSYIIILNSDRSKTVIQRRNSKDIWKGLYQFPLIETSSTSSFKELLKSDELNKISGNQDVNILSTKNIKHQLTHRQLFITIYTIQINSLNHLQAMGFEIINLNELNNFAFPKPLTNIIVEN